MRSNIKETNCGKKGKYPQLFISENTGNIYLYNEPSVRTVVHLGSGNGLYDIPNYQLGLAMTCTMDPYDTPTFKVFNGTVELTNP